MFNEIRITNRFDFSLLNLRYHGHNLISQLANVVNVFQASTQQQPTTNSQQPIANSQQPTANSQQPTANNQQPTANSLFG